MDQLTAEMIVDAVIAHETTVSPDGRTVAFTVAPSAHAGEHPTSAIWVAPADGSSPARRLTAGTAEDTAPAWAPTGDALYFLSDREKRGTAQIYRIPLHGGEAERLTDWDPGIAQMAPLPDDNTIAFLAVDRETDEEKERKERRDDADVYGEHWPFQRLRLLDLATRQVTTIAAIGDQHVAEIAPAADGLRIAAMVWPTPEEDNWCRDAALWTVETATGAATRRCSLPGGGQRLRWAGDGAILFLAHKQADMQGGQTVFALTADAGTPRQAIVDIPACPMDIAVARHGPTAVLVAEGLDSWVGRLDLATRRLIDRHDLPGDAWALAASDDGQTRAVGRSLATDLANIWTQTSTQAWRQVTDLNSALAEIAWGTQQAMTWTAPDGLSIDGVLILPAGATRADGPFPLFTEVHGGPYGRWEDACQIEWSRWGQWLATIGYAVFLPNPRGGMGRGHDFADRVAGAVGQEDWRDIEAGIDELVRQGIADPARLAIGGWSQGGFMTAWAVGQTERFKLGIMGAGVSDWGMMVATSDLPHFEAMLGGSTGWEGPGPHRHDALSPISFAHRVTTPVLILHGEEDARVPVSQGRFFARALREHGVPSTLVVYPREPHGIKERAHQLDLLRRVREWVARWLGPGWQPATRDASSG